MKSKHFIGTCLLLSLVLSSCGTAAETTDTTDNAQSATDTTPVETSEYTNPNVDYGGKTVTVASYDYSGSSSMNKYNMLLSEENGDVINDSIVKRNRVVEDELNIRLALFPLDGNDRGSTSKLQQQILAGDNTFDFALTMNAGLAPMLTTDGMLVDLNSVPTLDLTKSWWNQNANSEYTIYGKQFAAVGDICFYNLGAPIVVYFSKDMIKNYKLDDPYELVRSGKWTVDRMAEMATTVSRDLNGNQKVEDEDQFGFAAEVDSLGYMLMGGGVRLSEHTADGDIKITVNSERTVTLVEKLLKLFWTDNVSRLQAHTEKTYATSVHSEYFQPKLGQNQLLFYSNQLLVALDMRKNEADFGILPMAKYDEKQENYISFANTWWSDHLIIPATTTEPDFIGNVINAMGYYSQQYVVPAFIHTTVMGKAVRESDSAEMVALIRETQTFDVAYIFDWGKVRSTLSSMATNNNPAFATTYASIQSAIDSALATTLEALK